MIGPVGRPSLNVFVLTATYAGASAELQDELVTLEVDSADSLDEYLESVETNEINEINDLIEQEQLLHADGGEGSPTGPESILKHAVHLSSVVTIRVTS